MFWFQTQSARRGADSMERTIALILFFKCVTGAEAPVTVVLVIARQQDCGRRPVSLSDNQQLPTRGMWGVVAGENTEVSLLQRVVVGSAVTVSHITPIAAFVRGEMRVWIESF
jgi:hypothetical protein